MPYFPIDTPELLNNIAQLECDAGYFDFHNDFNCTGLLLDQEKLVLNMKHSVTGVNIGLVFSGVTFAKVDFSYEKPVLENLTMDSLYRGRFEIDGNLYEYDSMNRSYFYLEFYEGHKIEFFSSGLELITENNNE